MLVLEPSSPSFLTCHTALIASLSASPCSPQHELLQWRHSDNIILFTKWVQSDAVGLPSNFVFETLDCYEKKNMPKVIFCLHALRSVPLFPLLPAPLVRPALGRCLTFAFPPCFLLSPLGSHVLANQGLAQKIGDLSGQLQFTGVFPFLRPLPLDPSPPLTQRADACLGDVACLPIDEQLQAASNGLKGQTMPNFKSIGKDLAKEMNFEPPPETEDEGQSLPDLPPFLSRE